MIATPLRQAWAALPARLKILEPLPFPAGQWSLLERLHASFHDRDAQTRLPLPIARCGDAARAAILALARRFDDVTTVAVDGSPGARNDPMADFARLYDDDVDEIMTVLVPSARYRKGHYAYGRFTVPSPHGLHTDHSAEDPQAAGEPICIARIGTLGTHYVVGDERTFDPATRRMLEALRYWIAVPEGEPDAILETLLERGTLATIPVDHVVLMVAGNASENARITPHIAARPPVGGLHSAFFQRQYRLAAPSEGEGPCFDEPAAGRRAKVSPLRFAPVETTEEDARRLDQGPQGRVERPCFSEPAAGRGEKVSPLRFAPVETTEEDARRLDQGPQGRVERPCFDEPAAGRRAKVSPLRFAPVETTEEDARRLDQGPQGRVERPCFDEPAAWY
jgi:hypothetical protein